MANFTLRNGVRRKVGSMPQDGGSENTVAVTQSGGIMPWVLRFWAHLGGRRVYVGAVRTFVHSGDRLVAILSIPGASHYEVEGIGNNLATADEIAIDMVGLDARGGPWGVHAVPGNSVDGARSYRVLTGVSGAVNVVGTVFGWAARTNVAAATVACSVGPAVAFGPIGVPINGEVNGDALGLLGPESTWTFVNTTGYVIEVVPPGPNFDG